MAAHDELRYDKRLRDRHLRKGEITWEDQAKYLEDLPDVAKKGEALDEVAFLADARSAADRMRERIKTQPNYGRRPLPTPTSSFEDEEYADITPEGASE